MKSSKVNNINNNSPKVRNLSAFFAVLLAAVTLFQASNAKSNNIDKGVSMMEAQLIAETEMFFAEEELSLEEELYLEVEEEQTQEVSIFDNQNNLIASGNPSNDIELRKLVNQADYLSEFGNKKYYRLSK